MLVLAAGLAAAYAYAHPSNLDSMGGASFAGTVYDRATHAPEADVLVSVDNGPSVKTDANGAFVFAGVAAGKHSVRLSGGKLASLVVTEAVIADGQRLDVKYGVDGQKPGEAANDLEVLVTPQ